jgi:integrase
LRRTFASLLVALGRDPARVMAQMGHSSPTMTLGVYAAAMDWTTGERERLRAWSRAAI